MAFVENFKNIVSRVNFGGDPDISHLAGPPVNPTPRESRHEEASGVVPMMKRVARAGESPLAPVFASGIYHNGTVELDLLKHEVALQTNQPEEEIEIPTIAGIIEPNPEEGIVVFPALLDD